MREGRVEAGRGAEHALDDEEEALQNCAYWGQYGVAGGGRLVMVLPCTSSGQEAQHPKKPTRLSSLQQGVVGVDGALQEGVRDLKDGPRRQWASSANDTTDLDAPCEPRSPRTLNCARLRTLRKIRRVGPMRRPRGPLLRSMTRTTHLGVPGGKRYRLTSGPSD